MELPALFKGADEASNASQTKYLWLLRLEYGVLFVASIFALNLSRSAGYLAVYAALFIASIFLLLFRNVRKPQQDWYKCRALAESVKTSAWRYAMRSEPFSSEDEREARRAFRSHLREILDSNRHIGEKIAGLNAEGAQITTEMEALRARSLEDRKVFYVENRIKEQRSWYAGKSKTNKDANTTWTIVCVSIYLLAIAGVITHIVYPDVVFWPIGPLVVIASAIIGWMQIKKFDELASSYALTAYEIGLTEDRLQHALAEPELSECVNEAELAFSREHTQWVARQNK